MWCQNEERLVTWNINFNSVFLQNLFVFPVPIFFLLCPSLFYELCCKIDESSQIFFDYLWKLASKKFIPMNQSLIWKREKKKWHIVVNSQQKQTLWDGVSLSMFIFSCHFLNPYWKLNFIMTVLYVCLCLYKCSCKFTNLLEMIHL